MTMKQFFSIVGLVFLAELADKTQLTVLGLSGGDTSRWIVFCASSIALVLSTLLAVLFGDTMSRWIPEHWMNAGVGILFIGLGVWFLAEPLLE
ncbi:MAG: TMEM165/GDT1 family protein [bacterium]